MTTTTDPAEAIQLLTAALIQARGADDGVALLQELLSDEAPDAADNCPAMGCCGCGTWVADVRAQAGEMYCWTCVDKHQLHGYTVLPGRAAPGTTAWQIQNAPAGSAYGAPDLRGDDD